MGPEKDHVVHPGPTVELGVVKHGAMGEDDGAAALGRRGEAADVVDIQPRNLSSSGDEGAEAAVVGRI